MPELSSADDTMVYLCFGNSSIVTSHENVAAVWDSNYVLVSHDGGKTDSTSYNNDGNTVGGVVAGGVSGQVGVATSFDGINENTIINDTYNLDLDSLEHSLAYQLANCNGKSRVAIIGMHEHNENLENAIKQKVEDFKPIDLRFQFPGKKAIIDVKNTSILIDRKSVV